MMVLLRIKRFLLGPAHTNGAVIEELDREHERLRNAAEGLKVEIRAAEVDRIKSRAAMDTMFDDAVRLGRGRK